MTTKEGPAEEAAAEVLAIFSSVQKELEAEQDLREVGTVFTFFFNFFL